MWLTYPGCTATTVNLDLTPQSKTLQDLGSEQVAVRVSDLREQQEPGVSLPNLGSNLLTGYFSFPQPRG